MKHSKKLILAVAVAFSLSLAGIAQAQQAPTAQTSNYGHERDHGGQHGGHGGRGHGFGFGR